MPRLAGLTLFTLFAGGGLSLMSSSCGSNNEVRNVYMALDGSGNHVRKVFYPDTDTFFCDVDFISDRADITVDATIRQLTAEVCPAAYLADHCHPSTDPKCNGSWGGPLINVTNTLSIAENFPGLGTQIIAFQATKGTSGVACGPPNDPNPDPFPFPVGHYRCEITVDGLLQGSADFDIIYPGDPKGGAANVNPPCPFSPAYEGGDCFDYVTPGASCPASDQSLCQCDQTGTWNCTK